MSNLACRVAAGQKSLRSACDLCHQGKVKCSGGVPCEGCRKLSVRCKYSTSNRTGRPKGVKNKKTLERIKQFYAANAKGEEETRAVNNQASSTRTSQRSSMSQSLLGAQTDQECLPTPPTLSDSSSSQRGSNLSPVDGNSPESSWGHFPLSIPGNFSHAGHPPSLAATKEPLSCKTLSDQGPSTNNCQSSVSFELLRAGDIPGHLAPELSWVDDLFAVTHLPLSGCGGMDHMLKSPQGTDRDSSTIKPSSSAGVQPSQPQPHPSSACNCVRQITEQLAKFKTLSVSPLRLQPDFVLTVARDSIIGWRPYVQCPSCEHSDDKDVLVLSAMALRALLNLIQEISLPHEYQSRHDDTDEVILRESSSSAPFLDSQNSFLGTYQLACEEKRLVMDLLLYRTLTSLYRTAKNLKEKSLRMARTVSERDSISNRSSLCQSSSSPPATSPYGLPDEPTTSGQTEALYYTGSNIPLDEQDNYLQNSLQSLTASIESLLVTVQAPQTSKVQKDADMFVF